MLDKKGFTLIELLAVLVLISVITTIGAYSVNGIQAQIKKDMWNSEVSLITNRAKAFGQDNLIVLKQNYCGSQANCMIISVQTLLDRKYINSKEKDDYGNKIIVNKNYEESHNCYKANDAQVRVYLENNEVYAEFIPKAGC